MTATLRHVTSDDEDDNDDDDDNDDNVNDGNVDVFAPTSNN